MATGIVVRVDEELLSIIEDVIKRFEEEHKIKLSLTKASKLIAEKIRSAGGVAI